MAADANGIIQKVHRAAIEAVESKKPVNVCFGEVVSASPLKINVEQKMVLGEAQLILSRNVTDHKIFITVDHVTENTSGGSGDASFASHNHEYKGKKEVTVHNSLVVGDKVILLRQQEGQKFIVLDRID